MLKCLEKDLSNSITVTLLGGYKMKSLISFDGFADVANNIINRISNAVGWLVTHDTPKSIALDTYIKDVQNSDFDPITKAVLISQSKKTIKEYCNQNEIVTHALSMITPTARPDDVDEDWILQFMDKARLVSDSEFQIIWASILANEFNTPGTIPKALLHTLEQMDKHMAKAFMNVAAASINFIDDEKIEFSPIILREKFRDYYNEIGINLDNLIDLQSLGLIQVGDGITTYSVQCSTPVIVHYHDQDCSLPNKFVVGEVVYTRIGKVLCSVVKPEKIENFFDKICIPLWEKEQNSNTGDGSAS